MAVIALQIHIQGFLVIINGFMILPSLVVTRSYIIIRRGYGVEVFLLCIGIDIQSFKVVAEGLMMLLEAIIGECDIIV